MNPLKKGRPREEDQYMWECELRPHPHIYLYLLLASGFFSVIIHQTMDSNK